MISFDSESTPTESKPTIITERFYRKEGNGNNKRKGK
jgi:hypothetical protein